MKVFIESYKGYALYSKDLDDGRLMVFCEVGSKVVEDIRYTGTKSTGNKNQIKSLIESVKQGIDLYTR